MLRIRKLVTTCRAPRERQDVCGPLAAMLNEDFTRELASFLGPSLLGRSGYVQIERLRVRIVVRGKNVAKRRVMDGLVRAVCKELFTALAYPEAGGQFEVKRWSSPEQFRARFLLDLLSGADSGKWFYKRYTSLRGAPRGDAVFQVLSEFPAAIIEQLLACLEEDGLAAVLAVMGDLQIEKLFQLVIETGRVQTRIPAVADLRAVSAAYMASPLSRSVPVNDRRQALLRFAAAWPQGLQLSPHVWLACTTVLQLLSQNGELLDGSERDAAPITGLALSPDIEALMAAVRATAQSRTEAALLVERAGLPKPVVGAQLSWRRIENASLLLLIRPLLWLGWHRNWGSDFLQMQCWLYALACKARGGFDPALPKFDEAAGLLAGIHGEPSLPAMRRVYQTSTPSEPLQETTQALLGRLKSLLPGFRKAEDGAIVRQFLSTPGRVQVGPDALRVVLDANPFWIAAHMGGLDESVEMVPWFRGGDGSPKSLEIRLEGL
jgi:hypothetical protein